MNWNWAWVGAVTTLVMGPWNLGMAQERPAIRAQGNIRAAGVVVITDRTPERTVIRAQGGGDYPESYPAYDQGEYCDDCDDCDGPCCCTRFGRCWRYVTTLGGRQGRHCYDQRQLDFQYRYRYRAPKNLKYPAANQPAAVVVYPYYTVKGPDDFFLNE